MKKYDLESYKFPLSNGTYCHLFLPRKLSKKEAERIGEMIKTLSLNPSQKMPMSKQPKGELRPVGR